MRNKFLICYEEAVTAYVLVKTDIGKMDLVLQDILTIPQITKAAIATGDYDIVAEVTAPNVEKLISKIVGDIHKIGNIKETKTLVSARVKPYTPRASL